MNSSMSLTIDRPRQSDVGNLVDFVQLVHDRRADGVAGDFAVALLASVVSIRLAIARSFPSRPPLLSQARFSPAIILARSNGSRRPSFFTTDAPIPRPVRKS